MPDPIPPAASSLSSAAPPPAIAFRGISKHFGGVKALQNVAFTVGQGEVHCLAGENGCGKSTLIKLITGVYQPEAGAEMALFGTVYDKITPTLARKAGIAVIWQDLALFPEMSVAENIAFETVLGNRPRRVDHAKMRAAAQKALDQLDVRLDLEARLGSLPIAARQIVAIARALVSDARLIFMDEPTASLTQAETDALLSVVRRLSAQGVAVVFVSHRLAEVLEISSRVTVFRDGKLVGVWPTEGMTQARLTELMTGQDFDQTPTARDTADFAPRLELRQLSRQGEFHNVSFTLRRGEILGLTGLLGAGRTELAHVLFGMNRADAGEIWLEGQQVRFRSNREAIAAGMAYVSEDRLQLGLIQPQSIADNSVISVLRRISGTLGLISAEKQSDLVWHWIKALAVKIGKPEDAVSTLSGGNQQRVVLAKWLATEPKVLILDCPTVGVDVGARAGIFRITRALAAKGLSIVLISDEVTEVHSNADRILHMAQGRILGEYDPRVTSVAELEAAVYA